MNNKKETQPQNDTAALVEGILAEAEEKITTTLREADDYAARRLGAAKAQADALVVDAEKEASLHAAHILGAARARLAMERTRSALEYEEALMREAVRLSRGEFETWRKRPDYAERLVVWIAEAAIGVGSAEVVLDAAEPERKLVTGLLLKKAEALVEKTSGIATSIRFSEKAPLLEGGIIASSADGRIVYDNTANARFFRAEGKIRSAIRAELDGAEAQRDRAEGKIRSAVRVELGGAEGKATQS